MSNGSIESSGRQSEIFSENATEKQALDLAATLEPVKFNVRPIIIVVTILSCLYLIFFIVGIGVAFGGSAKDVAEAIEFNKIIKEAINNCKCIVSDGEWPKCEKSFCTLPEDSTTKMYRKIILLHGNSTFCKNWTSEVQELSCYYKYSQIEAFEWTNWTEPNVDNARYRIRQIPPYGIYYIPRLETIMEKKTG